MRGSTLRSSGALGRAPYVSAQAGLGRKGVWAEPPARAQKYTLGLMAARLACAQGGEQGMWAELLTSAGRPGAGRVGGAAGARTREGRRAGRRGGPSAQVGAGPEG